MSGSDHTGAEAARDRFGHKAGVSAETPAANVDDVQRVVDEFSSTGVTFVPYPEVTTDEKGVSPRAGAGNVAWFRDPDGNTFAVEGAA